MKSVINCYACSVPSLACSLSPIPNLFFSLASIVPKNASYLCSDSLHSFQLVLRFWSCWENYAYQTEAFPFIWGDHVPKHPQMPKTMQKHLFLMSYKMFVWWTWHVIRPCCTWEFPMVFDKLFVFCFSILLSLPHTFSHTPHPWHLPLFILHSTIWIKILWKIKDVSLIISNLNVSNHWKN